MQRCASDYGAECFRSSMPLADDMDFRFLAERFETTGGEIQAIALDAAFLAAGEESSIGMRHLMRAMTRRQTKQGNAGGWARYQDGLRVATASHWSLVTTGHPQ